MREGGERWGIKREEMRRRIARTRGGGRVIRLLSCFASERIYSLFSKSARRIVEGEEGPKRPEREKKNVDEKKEVQGRGEEGKYMPKKEERGVHAHFFLQREYIFHLRNDARDNHNYESKQRCGRSVLRAKEARRVRRTLQEDMTEYRKNGRGSRGRKIVGARCTSWRYRESNDNKVDRVDPTCQRIASIDRLLSASRYDTVT